MNPLQQGATDVKDRNCQNSFALKNLNETPQEGDKLLSESTTEEAALILTAPVRSVVEKRHNLLLSGNFFCFLFFVLAMLDKMIAAGNGDFNQKSICQ